MRFYRLASPACGWSLAELGGAPPPEPNCCLEHVNQEKKRLDKELLKLRKRPPRVEVDAGFLTLPEVRAALASVTEAP